MTSIQQLVTADDCPVDHYKMCSDSSCSSVLTDVTKYNFTGARLTLGLGTPIAPTTLYLGAFNTIETKSLIRAVNIEICGYETVSLATAGALSYTFDISNSSHTPVTIALPALFTSSSATCPIKEYILTMTNTNYDGATELTSLMKENFVLNGTNLQITPNKVGQFTFYIMAATESMKV